jgi:acetyl-CoA C-acetyltransferase
MVKIISCDDRSHGGLGPYALWQTRDETVESLIVKVARDAIADAGLEASDDVDEICSVISTPASPRRTSPPAWCCRPIRRFALQAGDPCRKRLRHRFRRRAPGRAAIRCRRCARVLVVGVEQMTTTPGPEIGANLLQGLLPEGGWRHPGGLRRCLRQDRRRLFPEIRRPVRCAGAIAAKNHKNGVDNPYAQMRKDLGFEFCRAESEKNPSSRAR